MGLPGTPRHKRQSGFSTILARSFFFLLSTGRARKMQPVSVIKDDSVLKALGRRGCRLYTLATSSFMSVIRS